MFIGSFPGVNICGTNVATKKVCISWSFDCVCRKQRDVNLRLMRLRRIAGRVMRAFEPQVRCGVWTGLTPILADGPESPMVSFAQVQSVFPKTAGRRYGNAAWAARRIFALLWRQWGIRGRMTNIVYLSNFDMQINRLSYLKLHVLLTEL